MPTEVNAIVRKGTGGRVIKERVHDDKLKPYYPRDETVQEVEIQVPGSETIDENPEGATGVRNSVVDVGSPAPNRIEVEGEDEELPIAPAHKMAPDPAMFYNAADGPSGVEPTIIPVNPAHPIAEAAATSSAIEFFHPSSPDAHPIPELVDPLPPPSPKLETAETPRYTVRQR
jgi:hypothetical protein